MSRGDLQEMEQSKTAVNAEPMPVIPAPRSVEVVAGQASVEDLGGPTPENYKPDDDSAKLKEPKVKTVKDVVTKGAKAADPMKGMKEEEEVSSDEVLEEEEVVEEAEESTENRRV